ncbi:FG-GAP repeat protein, partial [Streptomyces bungoensis]|uniref:FG-GAP repeat protein n=1 Tax=Streptomyces bungoensis TaxID=285568 RepID=UPI0036C9E1BB
PGFFGFRPLPQTLPRRGGVGAGSTGHRWGAALAAGHVAPHGRDDLIAGAPGEAIGTRAGAGAATLLFGGPTGLLDAEGAGHSVGVQQNTPCVPGVAETDDAFGAAVATGDYDHDGRADLAVGSPGENAGSGGVWLLPRSSACYSSVFTPAKLGLPAPSSALAYGRYLGGR